MPPKKTTKSATPSVEVPEQVINPSSLEEEDVVIVGEEEKSPSVAQDEAKCEEQGKEYDDNDSEAEDDEDDEGDEEDDEEDDEENDEENNEDANAAILQTMARQMVEKKIVFAFNRLYIDFLKDVKSKNKEINHVIKKNYKCLDKLTNEYIRHWDSQFSHDAAGLNWESQSGEVFLGVSLKDILSVLNEDDKNVVSKYMYTLGLMNYVFHELDNSNSNAINDLFTSILDAFKTIDAHGDITTILQSIVDDDIKTVLEKLVGLATKMPKVEAPTEGSAAGASSSDDFFETSKIGKLAKEISSNIDVSSLNVKNPADLLNVQNLLSGDGNNGLASIIQQVGSTITSKIQSGELKQEELIADAMSLVSKLNLGKGGKKGRGGVPDLGNMGGMMGDMMKMMMKNGMGMGGIKKKTGARERLMKKMEKRRQESAAAKKE